MKRLSEYNMPKRQRLMIKKTLFYVCAILLSIALLVFILITGKSSQPQFVGTVVGIWAFFAAFCSYKIYRARQYKGVFRKGILSVTELDDMDGIAFEELVCEILLANGFELAENTPSSGDYGVDVLAQKDCISYAIQCKRYNGPVGVEAVQQVYAGRDFYECHVAVVLTNQTFTDNAYRLADKIGVALWDRETLRDLL